MYSWKRLFKGKNISGFSLVEMSVALAAVSAVVVVTVGGSSMVQRSKLGTIVSDVKGFSKAVSDFDAKYKGIPGDIATVTSITGATAGNGNGSIDSAAEALQFWRHLALAGIIKGQFDGTSTYVPGTGVPAGPASSSGYKALDPTTIDANLSQALVIEFAGFTASSNTQPILTPDDAKAIDTKIDDGMPNTGFVRSVDSVGDNVATNCATGATATDTYNVNSKALGCRMRFILRKSGQADAFVTLTDGASNGCNQPGMMRRSDVVGDVCPTGTMGKVMKTCRIGSDNKGTWVTSTSHCQPVLCQGGKRFGEKRVLPCMNGQIGSGSPPGVVQTCNSEGVWTVDAVNCVLESS